MTTVAPSPESERGSPRGQAVIELLSSMRFAISLLTIICIASVIGTVLKQNEPGVNYVNQFGPFWAELFTTLKLNTVYSAWWFLLILAFLVISTSLCIARNTPKILVDLKNYKENIREQSLKAFHHKAEGHLNEVPEAAASIQPLPAGVSRSCNLTFHPPVASKVPKRLAAASGTSFRCPSALW
jgi:cytochrome c biogenesis protein